MKRKLPKLLSIFAAAAAVASVAVFGGGALIAWRMGRQALKLPESAALVPDTVARPGDAARATAEFALPWWTTVTEATAEAGQDSVISGPVKISSAWRWGRRIWRLEATVRPLSSRGSAPGRVSFAADRRLPGLEGRTAGIAIPAVKVAEGGALPAGTPQLAEPEPPEQGKKIWYCYAIGGAVLIAAAALLTWHILVRRRRRAAAATPWDAARARLAELRAEMGQRFFRPEAGVAELSDILRNYLAARFGLDSATAAGCGFLDAPAARAALTKEELEFLRGFFRAAEPVMFARFPTDGSALERSVDAAAALVERTVPPPPERKREKPSREARS